MNTDIMKAMGFGKEVEAVGKGLCPFCKASAGHTFAETAFLQKGFLQLLQLPVQQVAGHADQADDDIGTDGRVRVLDAFLEGLVIRAGSPVKLAEAPGVRVVGGPFFDAAVAHEITVIFEQFLLAGLGDAGELDFRLLGRATGFAAFEDVLLA